MKSVILFLLMAFGLTTAQNLTVEATGYGATVGEATANAKREALAQGIGQTLVSQTEVENFMVKRDYILSQTSGHVKKTEVLGQKQGPDGAWEVKVRAVVAKEGLAKDLVALMLLKESVGNPRIAMLVHETVLGNTDPTANKAESVLADFFKSKSFEVVDPSAALRFRESAEGQQAMAGDPAVAARLGAALNADVIIVGSVVSKESDVSAIPAMAKSGMKSASAVVSLKAINVSTRQIMAVKSLDAPAAHINAHTAGHNAVENAVKKLMNQKNSFFDALVENWRSTSNDGSTYQVTIQGVSSFGMVQSVKNTLVSRFPKVEQRGYQKPLLNLDVLYTGSMEDLCSILDGMVIGDYTLSVESFSGHTVQIKMQ